MWLKSWQPLVLFSIVSLFRLGLAQDEKPRELSSTDAVAHIDLSSEDVFDCSNRTHRWQSQNNECLLDVANATVIDNSQQPLDNRKSTGRFLGGLGLRIRDTTCAANETRCWIVNCCQPGETCGPINVGCTVSYSSIYSTTTLISWSTITDVITPASGVSYTTIDATTTAYLTTWKPVTFSGAGPNTVIQTSTTTITTLILSAYTPAPIITTRTVSPNPNVTNAPKVRKDVGRLALPRADIPRRSDTIRYTTVTVYVTNFYTTSTTSTLTNGLVTIERPVTISSIATRNQTFYQTPTAFMTITDTITAVSSSYAFGRLDAITQTTTVTKSSPSSEVAGTTPTDNNDASQTNPPGAYPPSSSHKLSAGAIAGLVVGVILALILLALLVVLVCCIRRRRNRRAGYDREVRHSRHLVDAPNPPSPPIPQMALATPSPPNNSSDDSPSPPAIGAISKNGHHSGNGYGSSSRYGHGRKSSRSSVVSITPVPEEDEDDLENEENNSGAGGARRNSGESTRSWGRGYGGRGGYYGRTHDPRSRNAGSSSPTNPAFRGVITSTYSDESLVPPHARAGQE